jgi:hypothetical protein
MGVFRNAENRRCAFNHSATSPRHMSPGPDGRTLRKSGSPAREGPSPSAAQADNQAGLKSDGYRGGPPARECHNEWKGRVAYINTPHKGWHKPKRMVRFVLRALAVFCLAMMVIVGVVDATRSIGTSAMTLTPLADSWDAIAPGSRTALGEWLDEAAHPVLADPILATVTGWPTVAVFGGLALVLALLGRRRRKRTAGSLGG